MSHDNIQSVTNEIINPIALGRDVNTENNEYPNASGPNSETAIDIHDALDGVPNMENGYYKQTSTERNFNSSKIAEQVHILLAESEEELRTLFGIYLSYSGIESLIVDDGERAIDSFLKSKNEGKGYDAVVIDTDLPGMEGLDVAKKIHESDKSQRIILITTRMKQQLPSECLRTAGIKNDDILTMPFELSKFVTVLKN
ncbi:MAG: response regulator [Candidatus Nitrosocosmicus sp.]|nr:response regulator [Candidatus Nitrosocosmicus sp.]